MTLKRNLKPTQHAKTVRMHKAVRVIFSCWIWFEIGLLSILGVTLMALGLVLFGFADRDRRILGRSYRLLAVLSAKLAPMWKLEIVGPVPRGPLGRTVVVCNHMSHLDSFFISYLPWEMKWLAKASLSRIPFIGWGMKIAGDIFVVRSEPQSIGQAMQRAAYYLRRNTPVFIFPEGTRSQQQELLPFKLGAFRLAIEEKAQILPLAIFGTQHGLPKHSWCFNWTKARITVGAPIETADLSFKRRKRAGE